MILYIENPKDTGAEIRVKLLTISTFFASSPGVPAASVSDGKLFPPSLKATMRKLYSRPFRMGTATDSRFPSVARSPSWTPVSKAPSSSRVYRM